MLLTSRIVRRTAVVRPVLLAALLVVTASCGGSDNTGPGTTTNPPPETVTSVAVSAPSVTLAPQQTVQFTAVAKNASGGTVVNVPITWSSNANAVATVNASGIVSGIAAGSAVITATSGSVVGNVNVTVTNGAGVLATVVVGMQDRTIQLGQTSQASISGRDGQGNPVALGTRTVTWTTSNPSVATINAAGIITGVGIGLIDVQATVADGAVPKTASQQLIVEGIPGAASSASVNMAPQAFLPFETTVKQGGTVNFVFPTLAHNVFWDRVRTGSPADINTVSDQTVSRTFPTVGVFGYKCTLHPGMDGTIIVTP